MKRWLAILLAMCLLPVAALAEGAPMPGTIQRAPEALNIGAFWSSIPLEERLVPDEYGVMELRSLDLSEVDLSPYAALLPMASFDDRTVWPDVLPEGFDPALLMSLGKDPGCGVRALHARGITGKGIGIGIVDQPLLIEHQEYADRLRFYEENEAYAASPAAMHGVAVASIALGETVGVAPDALLYFIAELSTQRNGDERVRDCTYAAAAIDRFLQLNEQLPDDEKIRVISISIGWMPEHIGVAEMNAAIRRAEESGVVVCTVNTISGFSGMGRHPYDNPNGADAARPGLFWQEMMYANGALSNALLMPMDFRCTASPTGADEYVQYAAGAASWVVPYVAGLYALALEVAPETTFQAFKNAAWETGIPVSVEHGGKSYSFGLWVDAAALIDSLM